MYTNTFFLQLHNKLYYSCQGSLTHHVKNLYSIKFIRTRLFKFEKTIYNIYSNFKIVKTNNLAVYIFSFLSSILIIQLNTR